MGVREEGGVFVFGEGVVASWFGAGAGEGLVERGVVVVGVVGVAVAAVRGVVSCRFEASALLGGLVADVLLSAAAADGEPTEAAADGFDEVPGVEDVEHGIDAEGPAAVGGFGVWKVAGGGF